MRTLLLFNRTLLSGSLLFLCAATFGNLRADPAPAALRLQEIKARIDSLEVEKQTEKRNGRSIDGLEQKTAGLQDSVAQLRQELMQQKQNPASIVPGKPKIFKKFIPSTLGLIDTIVIGAGAVTLVFAALSLFFLISSKSRRRKKNATHYPRAINAAGEGAGTRRLDATVQKAYGAQTTRPSESVPKKDVPRDQPQPGVPESPPVPPARQAGSGAEQNNLNDRVIQAARNGLDVKAISRRFHISVDQVALIVKMAGKR
jgi:hypothetical protein